MKGILPWRTYCTKVQSSPLELTQIVIILGNDSTKLRDDMDCIVSSKCVVMGLRIQLVLTAGKMSIP